MTRTRQVLLGVVVLLLVTGINAPLFDTYLANDDFEDAQAALDGTVFTGRSGFWNYNPVVGVFWLVVHGFDLANAALILRVVHLIIQATIPFVLWGFLRRLDMGEGPAWLSALLFVLHPLGFEAEIRLANMHYTLSLLFMLASLYYATGWLRSRYPRDLRRAVLFESLCLLTSFIGIAVVPALVVLHLFAGSRVAHRGWPGRFGHWRATLVWILPGVLYLVLFVAVLTAAGLDPARKYSPSLGMMIVTHFWIPYSLAVWDPLWGVLSYIKLTGIKTMNLPLLAWGLCSAAVILGAVLCLRNRAGRRALGFAFLALLITTVVPPKPHHMPRWCYFSIPWIAVCQAAFLWYLFHGGSARGPGRLARRALCVLLIGGAVYSSFHWYAKQIGHLRLGHRAVEELVRASRDALREGDRLLLPNMPQRIGHGQPWPRATFFWQGQLELALQVAGVHPEAVDVRWLDPSVDPRTPPGVEVLAGELPTHTIALVWDGETFRPIVRPEAGGFLAGGS